MRKLVQGPSLEEEVERVEEGDEEPVLAEGLLAEGEEVLREAEEGEGVGGGGGEGREGGGVVEEGRGRGMRGLGGVKVTREVMRISSQTQQMMM